MNPTNIMSRWQLHYITYIIQMCMCEQLFPASLDGDHTKTVDTVTDVSSPRHGAEGGDIIQAGYNDITDI